MIAAPSPVSAGLILTGNSVGIEVTVASLGIVTGAVIDEVVGDTGVRRIATTSTVQTGGWVTGLWLIIWHPALACLQFVAPTISSQTSRNLGAGRIAETSPISTVFRDRAGLTGNPAFAVNFFVTEGLALNKSTGLFDTAVAAVGLLALLRFVLTFHPAVTPLSPGAVIICGDEAIPWLSLVANAFHLFIASFVFRTLHVRLLLPAVASLRVGLSWRVHCPALIPSVLCEISWARPSGVTNSSVELLGAGRVPGTVSVAAAVLLFIAIVASGYHVIWLHRMTLALVAITTHWISVYLTGNISLPTDTSRGLIAHPARVNVVIKWFFSVADPIVHFKAGFLDFLTVGLIPLRPAVTVICRRFVTAI